PAPCTRRGRSSRSPASRRRARLPPMPSPALAAVALLAAYLLRSIPCSYLVARARGIDVRRVGSGNVGATNVMRSAGRAAGLSAFALDFLKGMAATALARRLGGEALAGAAAAAAVL